MSHIVFRDYFKESEWWQGLLSLLNLEIPPHTHTYTQNTQTEDNYFPSQ